MGEKETLNTGARQQDAGGVPPEPAATSNLNLSKSNINRLAGEEPAPEDATKVKGSKSNTSE